MAFLDKTTLIVDAVLTDKGREKLSKNEFQIEKFALSDDEIDYLLENDIKRVTEELQDTYFWFGGLNEARRDAMVDICFNLGLTKLRGFTNALTAMSREQFDVAADEFMDSKWAKQVGMRAIRVTEMIRDGEYQ